MQFLQTQTCAGQEGGDAILSVNVSNVTRAFQQAGGILSPLVEVITTNMYFEKDLSVCLFLEAQIHRKMFSLQNNVSVWTAYLTISYQLCIIV